MPAPLAGRAGSGVPAAAGDSESTFVLRVVLSAASGGYRNLNHYRTESALEALRDRPDLRLLMLDLAFPTQPFARDNRGSPLRPTDRRIGRSSWDGNC